MNMNDFNANWTPTNKKLPNDSEEYIVTVNMGDVNCVGMDYYSVTCGCFEGYGKGVIAWMPIPKPYNYTISAESRS